MDKKIKTLPNLDEFRKITKGVVKGAKFAYKGASLIGSGISIVFNPFAKIGLAYKGAKYLSRLKDQNLAGGQNILKGFKATKNILRSDAKVKASKKMLGSAYLDRGLVVNPQGQRLIGMGKNFKKIPLLASVDKKINQRITKLNKSSIGMAKNLRDIKKGLGYTGATIGRGVLGYQTYQTGKSLLSGSSVDMPELEKLRKKQFKLQQLNRQWIEFSNYKKEPML